MHSALVRGQNVFGFFTTVVSFVAGFIALSVVIQPPSPSATLALRNVQIAKGRPHYYSTRREEYAQIRFNLDMDLSSLFTWNTKQVFVYITATYPAADANSPPSRSIVWDAILPARLAPWHQNQYIHPGPPPEPQGKTARRSRAAGSKGRMYADDASGEGDQPGKLRLKGQKPKYVITDISGTLTGRAGNPNVTLELGYNVQPWVGALLWRGTLEHFGAAWPMDGGRSDPFVFPEPKSSAAKLETVRGAESNRGRPA